jgi:hypothetical protein
MRASFCNFLNHLKIENSCIIKSLMEFRRVAGLVLQRFVQHGEGMKRQLTIAVSVPQAKQEISGAPRTRGS